MGVSCFSMPLREKMMCCRSSLFSRISLLLIVPAVAIVTGVSWVSNATAADGQLRIATLIPGPPACPIGTDAATLAFQRSLREAGYSTNDVTQYCYAALSDLPRRVREILASRPSIILVWASSVAARAVKDATSTVPVVFADVADPVTNGLVSSLARPGGNVTGLTNVTEELIAKRVELLKEALPSTTRIGVLGNMSNPGQPMFLKVVQVAASRVGIEARSYPVEDQAQLAPAFAAMERDHMQALILLPDAWFYPLRSEVVRLAADGRLPAIYGNTGYADAGGLLMYGVNLPNLNVKVITYLDKILKGAKPGDLPVEAPTQFDFIVNQKTAREMGIHVAPAALLRATKVVE